MATLVVGDVQGCYAELRELLQASRYNPARDQLWFVGDLVNRGPQSLEVLRFVSGLGQRAVTTLGNHDLHLLAIAYADRTQQPSDTFAEVLAAPDADELLGWLRHQPLLHYSDQYEVAVVHAGIPHTWTLPQARQLAEEVERRLRGPTYRVFLREMYGNQPDVWHDDLMGVERLRVITNYLTRMRMIGADGQLEFRHKGPPPNTNEAGRGFSPWFQFERRDRVRVLFGHWAAINGVTNAPHAIALDTGCVWGRRMTALWLEEQRIVSVPSQQALSGED